MKNINMTKATDYGMNCKVIIICRVWNCRMKNTNLSEYGYSVITNISAATNELLCRACKSAAS